VTRDSAFGATVYFDIPGTGTALNFLSDYTAATIASFYAFQQLLCRVENGPHADSQERSTACADKADIPRRF
jgi:hypothetical protein